MRGTDHLRILSILVAAIVIAVGWTRTTSAADEASKGKRYAEASVTVEGMT